MYWHLALVTLDHRFISIVPVQILRTGTYVSSTFLEFFRVVVVIKRKIDSFDSSRAHFFKRMEGKSVLLLFTGTSLISC
jgi:hypothetical protein